MDQKQLDEKNLKVIVSGMKSKGYNTTVIKLNIVVTFAFVMLVFSIPYSFAANLFGNENWKWFEMLLAVFVGVSIFLLLQYGMDRVMKCDISLVKNLKEFKPIYKKHFITKHIINLIYCILLYALGLFIHKFVVCNVASYLLAFDVPHLFFRVLFTKSKKDAFLVYYPTSLRGALLFEHR